MKEKFLLLSAAAGFFYGFALIISMVPMPEIGVVAGIMGAPIGLAFGFSLSKKITQLKQVITAFAVSILIWIICLAPSSSEEMSENPLGLIGWFVSLTVFCSWLTIIVRQNSICENDSSHSD